MVGDAVIVGAVLGDAAGDAVSPGCVGDALVGDAVVGDTVVGDTVVGIAVSPDSEGDAVGAAVMLLQLPEDGGAPPPHAQQAI